MRPIAGTEQGEWPFLANNEREVFFVRRRTLYRVPLEGGTPAVERDSVTYASIGDRGSLLFEHRGQLWRSPAGARTPVPVAIADKMGPRVYASRFAQFLPGEDHALLTIKTDATDSLRNWGQGLEIAVLDVQSGAITPLGLKGTCARYSATGHLLYLEGDGTLMAVPFSLRTRKVTGTSKRIATGISMGPNESGMYTVDQQGVLVASYGAEIEQRELALVGPDGGMMKVGGAPRRYGSPVISPDGRRVAMRITEGSSGASDVWIFDIASSTLSRMTSGSTGSSPGGWTADGKKMVYIGRSMNGIENVYARPWDGSGEAELLMQTTQDVQAVTIDGMGRWVAASPYMGANALHDIVLAPIGSPAAVRPIVSGPAEEVEPRLSFDGTLLAYSSDESGRKEVYVRPIDGSGARIQVSVDGGTEPVWDRRTGMLRYRKEAAVLGAVLTGAPDLRVSRRDSLFPLRGVLSDADGRMYDVFPDGQRIFAVMGSKRSVKTVVYLGWPELLR